MSKRIFQIECCKAFKNRWFFISLIISGVFAFCGAYIMISNYFFRIDMWKLLMDENGVFIKNPHVNAETVFNSWIGGDVGTWSASTFFFLFPMLAVVPYGWSLISELKSGYIKNIFTRMDRRDYLRAKYLAAFLAGGVSVVLPMLMNFLTVACFIPMRMPEASEDTDNFLYQLVVNGRNTQRTEFSILLRDICPSGRFGLVGFVFQGCNKPVDSFKAHCVDGFSVCACGHVSLTGINILICP